MNYNPDHVLWLMCDCYVWPILAGGNGRCGQCGARPSTPVPEPPDGKAYPLCESWRIQ